MIWVGIYSELFHFLFAALVLCPLIYLTWHPSFGKDLTGGKLCLYILLLLALWSGAYLTHLWSDYYQSVF
jgi:hypothetical protein